MSKPYPIHLPDVIQEALRLLSSLADACLWNERLTGPARQQIEAQPLIEYIRDELAQLRRTYLQAPQEAATG